MDFIYLILGVLLIVLGIALISYYNSLVKEKKQGGLSFKIRTAGICLIIIGIGLIIRELNNII